MKPLSRKPLGPGLGDPLLMKPIDTDAPAASDCAQLGAVAVTVLPLCDTVAFQPWLIVLPLGIVQFATHRFSAAVLVLRNVTVAW